MSFIAAKHDLTIFDTATIKSVEVAIVSKPVLKIQVNETASDTLIVETGNVYAAAFKVYVTTNKEPITYRVVTHASNLHTVSDLNLIDEVFFTNDGDEPNALAAASLKKLVVEDKEGCIRAINAILSKVREFYVARDTRAYEEHTAAQQSTSVPSTDITNMLASPFTTRQLTEEEIKTNGKRVARLNKIISAMTSVDAEFEPVTDLATLPEVFTKEVEKALVGMVTELNAGS